MIFYRFDFYTFQTLGCCSGILCCRQNVVLIYIVSNDGNPPPPPPSAPSVQRLLFLTPAMMLPPAVAIDAENYRRAHRSMNSVEFVEKEIEGNGIVIFSKSYCP